MRTVRRATAGLASVLASMCVSGCIAGDGADDLSANRAYLEREYECDLYISVEQGYWELVAEGCSRGGHFGDYPGTGDEESGLDYDEVAGGYPILDHTEGCPDFDENGERNAYRCENVIYVDDGGGRGLPRGGGRPDAEQPPPGFDTEDWRAPAPEPGDESSRPRQPRGVCLTPTFYETDVACNSESDCDHACGVECTCML